jgi:hypothetical protein
VLYSALHTPSSPHPETTPSKSTSELMEVPQAVQASWVRKGRNLILCFDGTGEQYDKDVRAGYIWVDGILNLSLIRIQTLFNSFNF